MTFTKDQPAPHERSIFRKNIGRALLNKSGDAYLDVWEIDYTSRQKRTECRHRRDIGKEVAIELEITRILREKFSFRCIEVADQRQRMGAEGVESALIGTLAGCSQCTPSDHWLGRHSPVVQIRESGLWLVQHLRAAPLSSAQRSLVAEAITRGLEAPRTARRSHATGE